MVSQVTDYPAALPRFAEVMSAMRSAERADGWLLRCHERGAYLVRCREFVRALALLLGDTATGPILEVCAGDGGLARDLSRFGARVIATDIAAPPGGGVIRSDARDAIRRYAPASVLGSFVPIDLDLHGSISADSRVESVIALDATLAGDMGSRWANPVRGWRASRLPQLERWMVTRHDVWLDDQRPVLRHGQAWLLERIAHKHDNTRPTRTTPNGITRPAMSTR
jgi:hypothetical protein